MRLFLAAVFFNVAKLLFYKYGAASFWPGMSFYTFTLLSYDIDVFQHKKETAKNMTELGCFAIMFPKLLSGPVSRYRDSRTFAKGGEGKRFIREVESGLSLAIVGLFYKVVIADTIGILWHDIQTIGFESISTPLAWMGAAGYSLQLLFDFQGYSMMAAGFAGMMGSPLPRNFDHPYRARSIREFYHRWHMSLGRWFRDYLYIPLGGNRKGKVRTGINLLIVWAVTGIWHGRTLNFLLWGLMIGFLIVLEKCGLGRFLGKRRMLSRVYVWFLIPLSWMVFAITDFDQMCTYFRRLFSFPDGLAVNAADWVLYGRTYAPFFLLAFVVSTPAAETFWKRYRNTAAVKMMLCGIFWFCVHRIAAGLNNPFLYFSF